MENSVKSNKYLLLLPHASLPHTIEGKGQKQSFINNQSLKALNVFYKNFVAYFCLDFFLKAFFNCHKAWKWEASISTMNISLPLIMLKYQSFISITPNWKRIFFIQRCEFSWLKTQDRNQLVQRPFERHNWTTENVKIMESFWAETLVILFK